MIQIDTERLMNDIVEDIKHELSLLGEIIKNDMKSEIDRLPESGNKESIAPPEVRNYISKRIDKQVSQSIHEVFVDVGLVDDQEDEDTIYKALLINYGIGEYMSSLNPWLVNYLSSIYYNKDRANNLIYSRPDEQYYDMGYWSSSYAKHPAKPYPNLSQYPAYFYENAILKIGDKVYKIVEQVISEINLNRYLIEK